MQENKYLLEILLCKLKRNISEVTIVILVKLEGYYKMCKIVVTWPLKALEGLRGLDNAHCSQTIGKGGKTFRKV